MIAFPTWRAAKLAVAAPAALVVTLAAGVAALWMPEGDTARARVAASVAVPSVAVAPPAEAPDPLTQRRERADPPEAAVPAPVEPQAGPAVAADAPAWRRNAVQVALALDRPMIALVIDDMGLDRPRSARVVDLPAPLTLAYLPYAAELERQTAAAAAAGHELIVHVPMEPLDPAMDPGPDALRTDLTAMQILSRLERDLTRFDGFVGISNHMGSRFSADRLGMALVMETVRERGLLYLDSRTTPDTVGPRLAGDMGVTLVERDIFLDNEPTEAAVRAELARAEALAKEHGHAVAIGHPYDVTIDVLRDWLATASQRGFQVVPISAVGALRQARG